jgi:hypothetical protein
MSIKHKGDIVILEYQKRYLMSFKNTNHKAF